MCDFEIFENHGPTFYATGDLAVSYAPLTTCSFMHLIFDREYANIKARSQALSSAQPSIFITTRDSLTSGVAK